MGFWKMFAMTILWGAICGSVANVPDWAKILGFAMIFAGFVAHHDT